MADLIKKIKIKKQDGTFTDYIPIGAEAQNVSTSDGESVQLKLNKKPYYYNSVADMKADTKLKAGDMAMTLGYHSVNDGGSALYKIREINENETTDNIFTFLLDNGYVAELIYNDTINLNQLGAKVNDNTYDCYDIFSKAIKKGITNIKLLDGNYYFSRIILPSSININGNGYMKTSINALLSQYSHFISLDYGVIANTKIKNLKINGNLNNNEQTGLYIYALPSNNSNGGLWNTIFEDLEIRNFTENQIYFKGYDPNNTHLVVNQFITFNNINAIGNANAKDVLKIEEQQGQFLFNNCRFDNASDDYYNINIEYGDVLFNMLTTQNCKNAIRSKGSNIQINHPWIENITDCIITCEDNQTTFGSTISIINGTIRNSSNTSDKFAFYVTSRTILNIKNVSFLNSATQTVIKNRNSNDESLTIIEDCLFSQSINEMYNSPYDYVSISDTLTINTNRITRINASQNVTTINVGSWVKSHKSFNCYAHEDLTFSGTNFVNPQTIEKGTNFILVRLNPYQITNFDKWLIIV